MFGWLTKSLFRERNPEDMPRWANRALRDDMLGRLAVGPNFSRRGSSWMRAVEGDCEHCGNQRACGSAYAVGEGGVWRPKCWNVSAFEKTVSGA